MTLSLATGISFRDLEREDPATVATMLQVLDEQAEEAAERG